MAPLTAPIFPPLVLQPLFTRKAPDAATIATAEKTVREDLPPLLAYLEGELGEREFFVANQLSIADLAVASTFVNLRHAGFPPDAAKFPTS